MGSSLLCYIFTSFVCNFYMLLFLTLLCSSFSQPFCHDDERTSLLHFKESFILMNPRDAYSKIMSWTNKEESRNCCMWDGVECDKNTGYVIGLNLSSSFLYGSISSNSSLFNLVHLQSLDLGYNDFNQSQIPTAIKRLSMLTYLNLADSAFSGQIPSEVSHLSKLSSLYLGDFFNILLLKKPNLESLISNLTHLEQLDLSNVNISSTVPKSLANFSSLTKLFLPHCKLKGEFPVDIFHLPNLQELNVQFNHDLNGRLPLLLNNNSSLQKIWLAHTSFSGSLPSSIKNLHSLSVLDASGCNFSGSIPSVIGKLNHLTYLDLSDNNFVGKIPSSMGNLTQLTTLSLSSNYFSYTIPLSFSKLVNLEDLLLDNNDLSGIVDFDMFVGMRNLTTLDLSYNELSLLDNFSVNDTFPQITKLQLSGCNLRKFPNFFRHQKMIEMLYLDDNHIGGKIPEWLLNTNRETLVFLSLSKNSLNGKLSPICNLSSLVNLDLSHNKLVGKLPHCFSKFSKSITILKLRNNSFSGNLPEFSEGTNLRIFDLGYNLFEGKLPKSLAKCRKLGYLNIERNKLNDVFPHWLGTLENLEVVQLQGNDFHGVIGDPKSNIHFPKLRIIDLSYNNFIGKLPWKYIQSWEAMKSTSVEDFGYMWAIPLIYMYHGITRYMYYSFEITIAIKGVHREYEKIQNNIAVISLSNNKFDGEIPQVIGDLKGLYSLDLSNNLLKGVIPSSLGNLVGLESLDLSQNELSGGIPNELDNLSFLQYFNVSHNHLSGSIPQDHFSTFEISSYEGNMGLCGIPLPNLCGNSKPLEPPLLPLSDEGSNPVFQFGWKVVAIGYGCGFLVGLLIEKVMVEKNPHWFGMIF